MITRVPSTAVQILEGIPEDFVADGCTSSPDSFFGYSLRWACRIHDWRYCSRCNPLPTYEGRLAADVELRENIQAALPWVFAWVGWVYYGGARQFGVDAWGSCDAHSSRPCRHGVAVTYWSRLDA